MLGAWSWPSRDPHHHPPPLAHCELASTTCSSASGVSFPLLPLQFYRSLWPVLLRSRSPSPIDTETQKAKFPGGALCLGCLALDSVIKSLLATLPPAVSSSSSLSFAPFTNPPPFGIGIVLTPRVCPSKQRAKSTLGLKVVHSIDCPVVLSDLDTHLFVPDLGHSSQSHPERFDDDHPVPGIH